MDTNSFIKEKNKLIETKLNISNDKFTLFHLLTKNKHELMIEGFKRKQKKLSLRSSKT